MAVALHVHPAATAVRAAIEVPVPLEICWVLWEDRERIPQWMPWIKSVVRFSVTNSR